MKCDELKVHKAYNRWMDEEMPTPNDDLICNEVYLKDEVDAAITELKQKLQDQCISCPVKMQEDDVVAELKQNLEDAKATAYAESVDAGMENRRLKRALWLARARSAHNAAVMWEILSDEFLNESQFTIDFRCVGDPDITEFQVFRGCMDWMKIYENVERKCREKAEDYK